MKSYIAYFILALSFYMQNFIFSLLSSFVFIPSLLEFALVYILVLLISKIKYPKTIFVFWQILYLIHFSYISFFGRVITSSDIYLFFTHIVETYETFIYTLDIYLLPFAISILVFVIIFNMKFKRIDANIYILFAIFISLLFFMPNRTNDSSFLLLEAVKNMSTLDTKVKYFKSSKQLTPIKKTDTNIVLIIGESMRAREYQTQEYKMFENYFYKTIYAGATSTDVSIPLLMNGAIKPSSIDMANNLFTLAKQNDFKTTFITVQSEKSLKYIKPYLNLNDIDNFKIVGSRDDIDLIKELKKIDFQNQANLVVMQMQGQHSPYIYYPEYKKSTILKQYTQSMNYSDEIIVGMIEYMKSLKKRTVFIFTSDHGELIGEYSKIGHNTFVDEVYRVPMLIADSLNSDINYEKIDSHHGIYELIFYLLGYEDKFQYSSNQIRVNGSMISEEDGYKIFDTISK